MHRGGWFMRTFPALWAHILDGMRSQPGSGGDAGGALNVRCVELHHYATGGHLLQPKHRDNGTNLGCYLQICTAYEPGIASVDYNCAYDSDFYQARQKQLNDAAVAICPGGMVRYVNTPSTFLTARDYYGADYDTLAATKTAWDPSELFRVYQGIRPTGVPPDDYAYTRPYVRNMTKAERLKARAWDVVVKVL